MLDLPADTDLCQSICQLTQFCVSSSHAYSYLSQTMRLTWVWRARLPGSDYGLSARFEFLEDEDDDGEDEEEDDEEDDSDWE